MQKHERVMELMHENLCDSGHKFYYRGKRFCMKSGAPVAVTVSWNVMPCSSVVWYRRTASIFRDDLPPKRSFVITVRREPADSNITKHVFSTRVILMEFFVRHLSVECGDPAIISAISKF